MTNVQADFLAPENYASTKLSFYNHKINFLTHEMTFLEQKNASSDGQNKTY